MASPFYVLLFALNAFWKSRPILCEALKVDFKSEYHRLLISFPITDDIKCFDMVFVCSMFHISNTAVVISITLNGISILGFIICIKCVLEKQTYTMRGVKSRLSIRISSSAYLFPYYRRY